MAFRAPIVAVKAGVLNLLSIDATIVRMILVPAAMEILGEKAWWAPRWSSASSPKST